MKRIPVIVSLALAVLLFSGGFSWAEAEKEEFSGTWSRLNQGRGEVLILPTCRRIIKGSVAEWQVETDNKLVSGLMTNIGTSSNREIIQFNTDEGAVPCVPGEDPPEEYTISTRRDMGAGVTYAPFMLKPTRYGGYWVGEFRIQYFPDGSQLMTAEAKGYTAFLEGRELRVYSGIFQRGEPTPFKGWILTPVDD